MQKEPVGIGALVVLFVNSLLQACSLLGVFTLTADELAAVNLVVVNFVVLVAAVMARKKVTPVP